MNWKKQNWWKRWLMSSEEHKLSASCAALWTLKLRLWGRSAALAEAQAQACELEAQLISSSREQFYWKIYFALNPTIIFNLDLTDNCSFKWYIQKPAKRIIFFKITTIWMIDVWKMSYFYSLLFKGEAQKRSSHSNPDLLSTNAAQRWGFLSRGYKSSSLKLRISGRCSSLLMRICGH